MKERLFAAGMLQHSGLEIVLSHCETLEIMARFAWLLSTAGTSDEQR